ncbi:MAG: S53 family peptidase [Streptosporangiales bacterium]|nr:S53 family peptidase [Streptosporangiales bacterium]
MAVATALAAALAATPSTTQPLPAPAPLVSDWQYLKSGVTPPTEGDCFSAGRRCFTPSAIQASYDVGPLHASGFTGKGETIAIFDSFGYDQVASDLKVFSQQFGLPLMCGMPDVPCSSGTPTFRHIEYNGNSQVKAPPPDSNGTGQQQRNLWALEVALDVQSAHAIAPGANILLVTTNPAETLGVQGFTTLMNAEQYVIDNNMADVISQSFGAGEESFTGGTAALQNLRHAFQSAAANKVTVFASSGDGGSTNSYKEPVKNPKPIPFPSVIWPASDPLVVSVGGTYLCTNPATGTGVDSTDPPAACRSNPGVREVGWIDSGGGFSHVFPKPSYQNTLPAGSTPIGSTRGVPDVGYNASATTGVYVYDTSPADASGGLVCPTGDPCSSGWYVVGGTSASSPQWAALTAIGAQIAGHRLGDIHQALYGLANSPQYATDFYDVTTGNNTTSDIPGYPATEGWDPVTGLGTPVNSAALLPALAAAAG